MRRAADDDLVACPCGCGAEFVRMVADRERGLRADTLAAALHLIVLAPPAAVSDQRDADRSGKHVAGHFRHLGPLLDAELAGMGLWIDNGGQAPLDTVRAILARGASGRL